MKSLISVVAVALSLFLSAAAQNSETRPSADSLGWMAGCWELTSGNGATAISEQWMKPSGGTLMGMSRTVRNGKTTSFEFLRIVESEQGLSYISRPSENKEDTAFALTKLRSGEAVFENPAHDFPQRIIYRQDKSNLFARIEGMSGGKLKGIDFLMRRAKCD